MVVINTEIEDKLAHFSAEEQDLAKVVLFVIDNNLSPKNLLLGTVDISRTLEILGLTRLDYTADKPCYTLVLPLYVSSDEPIEVRALTSQNIRRFLKSHIQEYRNIFSTEEKGIRGLKSGTMGDKFDCIKKLEKWFRLTRFEYSWKDVLATARVYVSKESESSYKYLQAADYFVTKNSRSRLSSLIDDYKDRQPEGRNSLSFKQLV